MPRKTIVSNFSNPTILALVGYLLLLVVVLIPMDLFVWDERTQRYLKVKYRLTHRLFMVLFLSLPIALTLYNIQCVMTGNCRTWSWLLAVCSFVMAALFVVQNFMMVLGA
jgi:hypothetical protein